MNALRAIGRRSGIWGLTAALAIGVSAAARAQGGGASAAAPGRSVLLFPAVSGSPEGGAGAGAPGAGGAAAAEPSRAVRDVQESVTEALRKNLTRSGMTVTIYNRRLPSIQRAVGEGTLTADVATTGLRDTADNARAQRLAEIIGATSFVTATIDDYRFDAATRTATFNLSVSHVNTDEGNTLGTAAAPGRGEAPVDVAGPLQQGSASARAAESAAEQAVQGLFPRAPQPDPAQQKQTQTRKNTGLGRDTRIGLWALAGLFGAAVLGR